MFNGSQMTETSTTHVRNIALLPGETIDHIFSPELGLTQQPSDNGQLLITTNQRVLAFCRNQGRNETHMLPVSELQIVTVKTRTRSAATIAQGVLLGLGAILLPGGRLLDNRPCGRAIHPGNQHRLGPVPGSVDSIGWRGSSG